MKTSTCINHFITGIKSAIVIAALVVCGDSVSAQGLEDIIVETYYISDVNDQAADADGGVLPVGSVTYRIYADMLPGYKFQAAYGVPGHDLFIQTSTLFFNNEDRGATTPTYSKSQARNNTVMLDSWLSVGAACTGNFGVLKADDDTVATVVNSYVPQVLQSANPLAGIPVSQRDGMIAGTPEPVTIVGITNEIAMFDAQNDGTNGPLFFTDNGSWASLNGSEGPNADNRVLIAQITTDGAFSFELNIQIGTPGGGVENYVAQNPVSNEILFPGLTYPSSSTGISSRPDPSRQFVVFPNPASDKTTLRVKLPDNNNTNIFSLYNMNGQLVIQEMTGHLPAVADYTMDLGAIPSGIYQVVVNSDGVLWSQSLVKN